MESSNTNIDPRNADLGYVGFPSFSEWAECSVDTRRWETYTIRLRGFRQQSDDLFRKALRIVSRAAAVDTGAIENLYKTDRGFTFTVAMEVAAWESAVAAKGESVRPLLEAQFKAYDYVLDLATQQTPVTEAWIRQLHQVICEGQNEYQVWTELGPQKHLLPKGKYKVHPNHVRLQDGQIHAYAPVDMTPDEMYRLCKELESEPFKQAHPVLQSAYAHYAFVAIHPFADGNGRVARALASVFTLRAESVPVLILADTRPEYYQALQQADQSNYQPFVDFMFERSLDAVQLASDSFEAASIATPEESLTVFEQIYKTRGGYTHEEVDTAGFNFLNLFLDELTNKSKELFSDNIEWAFGATGIKPNEIFLEGYRKPVKAANPVIGIQVWAKSPANITFGEQLILMVPVDSDKDDSVILHNHSNYGSFSARIKDLLPKPTTLVQLRTAIMADTLMSKLITEITREANQALRNQGYK